MNTVAWLSDVHLDMVKEPWFLGLCDEIQDSDARSIWLTGDIATGKDVGDWLIRLHHRTELPIYFVLGNHDYYHSSFARVDQIIKDIHLQHEGIVWMDIQGACSIDPKTMLVGAGGWGDARSGDFYNTPIRINDHRLIEDLSEISRKELYTRLQSRGEEMAFLLDRQLRDCSDADDIWVLTHVPPFVEACWYKGKAGDPNWIADFVCVALGKVLERYALNNPNKRLHVLCGHGHNRGIVQKQKNLCVYTASAEYSKPRVEAYWSI